MTGQRPLLVFVHGWGFDASFWNPLRAALSEFDDLAFDLGFLGDESLPEVPAGGRRVAVGHSTGFLWLLKAKPFAWDALVSINGFSRFVEGEGFRPAVAPRLLDRMIARLGHCPEEVTADFLARCGSREKPGRLNPERLHEGLIWLRDWDARAELDSDSTPVLVLAGKRDPIVPVAMTEHCFAANSRIVRHWHETGGHLLPLSAPAWCARHIREFFVNA